jgi:predicted DNA-binding transcriptional regulator AlpA
MVESLPCTEPWPALMVDRVVAAYIGISPRQVWKLSATNVIPAPVSIPGTRKTLWRKSEIDRFIAGLKK